MNLIKTKSNVDLIIESFETGRILKGTILQININNDIKVSISKSSTIYSITIPNEDSTLYIPTKMLNENDKTKMTTYLKMYVGKTISFVVKDIKRNKEDTIINVTASMKLARRNFLKNIRKSGLIPNTAKVNVIGVKPRYIVVEWNGIVQTVSDRQLSYSEIPDMKSYVSSNKCNLFEIVRFDAGLGYVELDRKNIIGDIFKEKIENKEYSAGNLVLGTVCGKTADQRLLIEIEKEIIAIGYAPENIIVKKGDKVSGVITGIHKTKRKLYLSSITLV